MTVEESEYNRQSYLKEALGNSFDPNVSNKLQPQVDLNIVVDHKSKKKELQVLIKGLSAQSVGAVQNSQYGYNKEVICTKTGSQGKIDLYKALPYFEVNKRKKEGETPEGDATEPTQAQAPQQDEFNLDDELADLLKESDDFDLDSMLSDIMGDGGSAEAETPSEDNAPQGETQTPENMKKSDEEVWKWLNTVYKGVIDVATNGGKNTNYTDESIKALYDIPYIYSIYVVRKQDPNEARIYNEKTDAEINEEIRNALKTGDWSRFGDMITPLDIDAVIWGNQLSSRNVSKILKQAKAYGFTPTMVHGATMWPKYYNRRVKPGARPFHVTMNAVGRHDRKDTGSKGHVEGFGTGSKGMPYTAYDIADTEIIDPNKGDLHATLPGLENNLTGAKNQAAIDYIQQVKSQIPQELLDKAEATNTDGGKAKIYNEVLSAYCQQNVQGLQLTPIDENADDNTAIAIYTRNIYALAEAITKQFNYANPQNAYRVADALAFCIAYYTTGADKLQVSGKSHGTNVQSTWKEEADSLVSNVRIIFNFIRNYIKSAFAPLRNKINELLKAENKLAQAEDEGMGEEEPAMAQKAAPAASNTLNEGVNLDCLLNDIRNFKL
jgi:hypothetical protein